MLNVNDEVNRLKNTLSMRGVPRDVIDGVSEEIRSQIRLETYDALDAAMQKAQEAGEDYKLDNFLDELTAVRIGDSYKIGTDSGNTDFSTPPFPMLPRLLKNAKIAKDGSRYKVIPMSNSGTPGLTTEKAIGDLNRSRQKQRQLRGQKTRDPSGKGETYIDMYTKQRSIHKSDKQKMNTKSNINFKTVSSKQDANTQWVYPGKNADMSDVLRDINDDLMQQVQDIIQSVIAQYDEVI